MDIEQIRKLHETPPSASSDILRQAFVWTFLLALAAGVIYTGSIVWQQISPPVDPAVRAAEIDARDRKFAAEEGVRYYAKDSESVQFREVVVLQKMVCGQYNAKNSFGAYAGFQRFVSDGKESLVTEDHAGEAQMDVLWQLYCK